MPATEPKQPKPPKKKAGCEGEERKNLLEMNLRDFLYCNDKGYLYLSIFNSTFNFNLEH